MATGKGQAVGFVYELDKTIAQIGTDVLGSEGYANKLVFTAEGIVLNGNIVAEPNSDILGSVIVTCYQKEAGDNPKELYSDSACTEAKKITPSTAKLYYVKGTGRTLEWVEDLGYYATVSDVYTVLKGIIDGLDDKYGSKSLVQELTTSVSAMDSRVTANANNIKAINDSKGAADGIATLDGDSKVTSSQLPAASSTVAGVTKVTGTLTNSRECAGDAVSSAAVFSEFLDMKNTYLPGKYIKSSLKGAANGVAPLNDNCLIDPAYLPSYVDDVVEGYRLYYSGGYFFFKTNEALTVNLLKSETGKIYVDLLTNKTYRWGGSTYVEISESLAIGTTAGTAFSGKTGNDHVNNKSNPHSVTKAQVGLGNADNTADADKNVNSAKKDGQGNVIAETYFKSANIETSALNSTSDTTVPSVKLVYNETVKVWTGTQDEYDALASYDSRTAYLITDASETVYADMDFGEFYYGFHSAAMTEEEIGAFYHTLYTNGVARNRQVYMHCTFTIGSSFTDKGWHPIEYRGEGSVGGSTTQRFSCSLYGEHEIIVDFFVCGPTTAKLKKVELNKLRKSTSDAITASSTNDTVPTSKAVYDLVSPLITQLTWQ